jgi:hypothetical protein
MKIVGQHLTDAQQRITQLEVALEGLIGCPLLAHRMAKARAKGRIAVVLQLSLVGLEQAQHALAPGAYKEWCRDPTLCQDKGTCPKDPTCAD